MKQGFTLLELIVVIIIIGTLGTFGFTQYSNMLEKGREAEAKANLGMLRRLQLAYHLEHGTYAWSNIPPLLDPLNSVLPFSSAEDPGVCSNTNYFFAYRYYGYAVGEQWRGACRAYRCYQGGKFPNIDETTGKYEISLFINGTWSQGTAY